MRNNIFYNLSIDRDKAKLDKSADQINDAIRVFLYLYEELHSKIEKQ